MLSGTNTKTKLKLVLYDMYVATNTLEDCEYTDVKEDIA